MSVLASQAWRYDGSCLSTIIETDDSDRVSKLLVLQMLPSPNSGSSRNCYLFTAHGVIVDCQSLSCVRCLRVASFCRAVADVMRRNRFILQKHRSLHDTILGMCRTSLILPNLPKVFPVFLLQQLFWTDCIRIMDVIVI